MDSAMSTHKNARLGNSLISLGPHGGTWYKYNGSSKDNYGLSKQYWNIATQEGDRLAWEKFRASHPKSPMTEAAFIARRRKNRAYKKQAKYSQLGRDTPYHHFATDKEFRQWKREQRQLEKQKMEKYLESFKRINKESKQKKMATLRYKAMLREEKLIARKRAACKASLRRARSKPWSHLEIKYYYYHKEDIVLKNDIIVLQQKHYCGSKHCTVTNLRNQKVTIQCDECNAVKRIPYTKFWPLYYNAIKKPYV